MRFAVYLPLVVPLIAAAGARPLTDHLPPRSATWLLTISAVVLAVGSSAALAFLLLAGLARLPLIAAVGHYSLRLVERADTTPVVVAVSAGLLLAAAIASTSRSFSRRARALVLVALKTICLPTTARVIVREDTVADAYAMPGLRSRIIVSTGMLAALNPAEQAVLLAHERAHLTHQHHLFTTAVRCAAAANPLLRPMATAVEYSIERWADEVAANATGSRRRVATAVGKAALATQATPRRSPRPSFALGITGRPHQSLRSAGPVPRRVAALLAAPPTISRPLLATVGLLLLAATLGGLEAARDLHSLIALL